MSPLNNEQKRLLFDYSLGLTSEEESIGAEALIASNKEAAEIHSKIKAALSPLDSLEMESCPDELVEGAIGRAGNVADSGQLRLRQLLQAEQAVQTIGLRRATAPRRESSFWRNFGEIAAVAAAVLLIAGVLIPSLNVARQKYWQKRCEMQLSSIFQGLTNYMNENDGKPPTVATQEGAPWWKVGYQGQENCSNTRHIWLLVKGGYVKPNSFVCPGGSRGRALRIDISGVPNCNDFPDKSYITYSIQIKCPNIPCTFGREPIISDANPIFDSIGDKPNDAAGELSVQLNDTLLKVNSQNHNRRGQNVLFGDGAVIFLKQRHIDAGADDIFTLRQMHPGFEVKGCELPSTKGDFFLVP